MSIIRTLILTIGVMTLASMGVASYASANISKNDIQVVASPEAVTIQNVGTTGILLILVLREILDFLRRRGSEKNTTANNNHVDIFDIREKINELLLLKKTDTIFVRELHEIVNTKLISMSNRNLETSTNTEQAINRLVDRIDFILAQK